MAALRAYAFTKIEKLRRKLERVTKVKWKYDRSARVLSPRRSTSYFDIDCAVYARTTEPRERIQCQT